MCTAGFPKLTVNIALSQLFRRLLQARKLEAIYSGKPIRRQIIVSWIPSLWELKDERNPINSASIYFVMQLNMKRIEIVLLCLKK